MRRFLFSGEAQHAVGLSCKEKRIPVVQQPQPNFIRNILSKLQLGVIANTSLIWTQRSIFIEHNEPIIAQSITPPFVVREMRSIGEKRRIIGCLEK